MGKTLYLECSAGISGDMFVAALLDLGADEQKLRKALDSLPAGGFTVQIKRVKKAALDTCSFDVLLDEQHENHDHDMAYLHGHEAVLHEEDHHEGEHHEETIMRKTIIITRIDTPQPGRDSGHDRTCGSDTACRELAEKCIF